MELTKFKAIYEIIDKKSSIKIFFQDFRKFKKKNNKNLRFINRNKLFYLSEKTRILNVKEEYLNIKLIVLNNSKLNLRLLFNDCNSLIKFIDISKKEKIFKLDDNVIEKEHFSKSEELSHNKNINLFIKDKLDYKDNYIYSIINNNIATLSLMISKIPKETSMSNILKIIKNASIFSSTKINSIRPTNISGMFSGCSSLIYLPDISKLNISNINNISSLFNDAHL